MGRFGLCSGGGHPSGRPGRFQPKARHSICLLWDNPALRGHDSRMLDSAAIGGKAWQARSSRVLLHAHADFHSRFVRICLLLRKGALVWFLVCLFFLGLGGANFGMYTLWLPEQYRTECRASAFAFSTSVGRFVGAGITFLVGAGVSHFHTLGIPVALTGAAFAVGILLLPLGVETRGKPLPA